MNYFKHYDLLITRARSRTLEGYTERHHIVPRCMEGVNISSNIVKLTPEEHYVAHLLLVKMYPDNIKLVYAADHMTHSTKNHRRSNNKSYGWIRRCLSQYRKGKPRSPETKEKISKTKRDNPSPSPQKGKTLSTEHKAKLSEAKRGKSLCPEHRKKISESLKGNKRALGYVHTEETKRKMSEAHEGKKHSEETRAKIGKANSISLLGRKLSEETRRKISEARKNIRVKKEQ